MKVLWLTNIPSPYRVDFFNLLGEKCDLTVLFELSHASDRDKSWMEHAFRTFRGIVLKGIRTGSDKSFCPGVVNWLKKGKYDCFVISNISTPTGMLAIQILKRKGIPFHIEVDGGFVKDGNVLKEKIKKNLIHAASFWFSTGSKATEYLIHYGAKKDKIFWYPFSSIYDDQILKRTMSRDDKSKIRRELGIEGSRVAVAAGQFIHRKGFDVLIDAWAEVDAECTLLLIGSGELLEEYTQIINRLSLRNVLVVNHKRREELFRYFMASDFFILPTREDIWGLVVNEAMACGLPVITTTSCIAGLELVEDGRNGYLIPPENRDALLNSINRLLYDEGLQERMSIEGLDRIREYTLEKMAERHMTCFHSILPL